MDREKKITINNNLPLTVVVTVVLLVLKLFKIISIEWIWVFSPLWIAAILNLFLWVMVLFITWIIKKRRG